MRGVIEQLIVENNGLNEKLKLTTEASSPDQLKKLNEQVQNTFENEFQQEYFKMKDKLRTKETEIRNLKLTISLSSQKAEDLLEQASEADKQKAKVK